MSCAGLSNSKFSWLSRPKPDLGAKNSDPVPGTRGASITGTAFVTGSAKVE